MIDLHRESATDPRTAHRISEIDRALSLIRGVVASQYRFLDSHATGDLSTVAGILTVERALLQQPTPQSADPAEEELAAMEPYDGDMCKQCDHYATDHPSGICAACRIVNRLAE